MGASQRILVVDDERRNRTLLKGVLKSLGYESELASQGYEALIKLRGGFDGVLLDVMMPGMDGFEVARRIRSDPDLFDLPIIMITALSAKQDRIQALRAGANGFVTKPVDRDELSVRLEALLKMKENHDEIKRDRIELQATVSNMSSRLRHALLDYSQAERQTRLAYEESIHHLALAAESKDDDTGMHIQRVSGLAVGIAKALNLTDEEVEIGGNACCLHDVGKIGIPDSILRKEGSLNPDEWAIMKSHTLVGSQILSGSSSPLLQTAEMVALTHHEKWDGSGYPHGLKGEEIPVWGRICAIADAYDALTNDRAYRKGLSQEEALRIIVSDRGKHFDPKLVDLFTENLARFAVVRETNQHLIACGALQRA
jgi:putative two-component system response regulator